MYCTRSTDLQCCYKCILLRVQTANERTLLKSIIESKISQNSLKRRTLEKISDNWGICNPVLVCAPPVPANIRLQGHTSNSEREAFPTQDLLHGTVSHNTFEK